MTKLLKCACSSLQNNMFSYIIITICYARPLSILHKFPLKLFVQYPLEIHKQTKNPRKPYVMDALPVQLHHGSKIQPDSAGLLHSLWSMRITVLTATAEDILPYYIASYASHEYITE